MIVGIDSSGFNILGSTIYVGHFKDGAICAGKRSGEGGGVSLATCFWLRNEKGSFPTNFFFSYGLAYPYIPFEKSR